jgi:hypothetical protein
MSAGCAKISANVSSIMRSLITIYSTAGDLFQIIPEFTAQFNKFGTDGTEKGGTPGL